MTDPVYEGKSIAGMIDLVRKGYFPAGSKVLYAHLGGVAGDQRLQLRLPQRLMSDALAPALTWPEILPERPPVFSSRRMSPMVMALSAAFSMS